MILAPGIEGWVKTPEEERAYDLCALWNARAGADMDVDGMVEAELESLGFTTRRANGKPRRELVWWDAEDDLGFYRKNSIYYGGRW
jgi:hypothetical protein